MIITTVAGRIGKDAEVRQAGDTPVAGFPVAADVGFGEKKQTLWFDCSLWGNRGTALAQYLTKGSAVTVVGEQGEREYNGKTYHTIRVHEVALQGGKQANGRQERVSGDNSSDDMNDSVPF